MPPPSLDPLRYGLRALDVLARGDASVLLPTPTSEREFRPHLALRPPSRDGAALSLRLFSPDEDATEFVLRKARELRFGAPPARAAGLFEAHAAAMSTGGDEELVVGFPLVSFVHQGQRRAAPLLSWSGARASWRTPRGAWKPPAAPQPGSPLELPAELVLYGPDATEDEPLCAPHGGLWSTLFDLDPGAWSELTAHGGRDIAALVRAATRLLALGTDDMDTAPSEPSELTREDLHALCDAVRARASSRYTVQCFPHGLAMLLPRGDPTSGLRAELRALEQARAPTTGPLAVYLGAAPAASSPGRLVSCGETPPTPSQVRAARAFEGSRDLVAVCGPPGCGKTTLLHHLAAHVVVECALNDTWVHRPGFSALPWPLVITSTNNAAVDNALAPFTHGRALPVGLRLGNRRSMAESTAAALRETIAALGDSLGPTLPSARAAFEARGRALREPREEHSQALDDTDVALDPSLVDLALGVRDAWARQHRARLLPALREALGMLHEDRRAQGRSLPRVLASLSALFPVVGCTLLSMRAAFAMDEGAIDRLVIDEAGQCAPVYAIPALARARRALLTGDTAQLPPVYTLSDALDARLAGDFAPASVEGFHMGASSLTSAQDVASRRVVEIELLEHFRSQPAIVALASSWSGHSLDVRTPPRSLAHVSPRLSAAVQVEHVAGVGARGPEGVVNALEAERALAWVAALLADGVRAEDLAVLTPFVGQSLRIERALRAQGLAGEGGVLVKTVHKLQGGERRVVVFSVVATEPRHLRWLRERPHLLHVATSRAQDHLVVLVHCDVARTEPVLEPFVRPMRS